MISLDGPAENGPNKAYLTGAAKNEIIMGQGVLVF